MKKNENDFDYQVLRLSDLFYKDYPNPPYIEIMKKVRRAYNCLLIQTHYDYYICIPYRSHISHKYAFINKIKQEAQCFIEDYVSYIIGDLNLSDEEFQRRYQFSPLKYFHKELGIKNSLQS